LTTTRFFDHRAVLGFALTAFLLYFIMGNSLSGSAPALEKVAARRAVTLTAQHLSAPGIPDYQYNAIVAGATGATVTTRSGNASFLIQGL
jgi:hypothetical protein